MIRLCVFDMDGLLLDSERILYLQSGLEASEKVGRPLSRDFLCTLMGGSWTSYEEKVKAAYGQDYPLEEFWQAYWERNYRIINEETIPLRPGVREVLDYCRQQKISMAVATSSSQAVTQRCLEHSGIREYFDYLMCADMVAHTKPDPEIFLKAIGHFNVPLKEALVLEDGHNGAQAAINGGCRFVLVEDLAFLSKEDKDKAELVTDDIRTVIDWLRRENEGTAGV